MNPDITVYNSYKKGIKTIPGSFPLFNNTAYLACVTPTTNIDKKVQFLTDLYESYDNFFLMTEESDYYNQTLLEFPTTFYDPSTQQTLSDVYNLLIGNELDLQVFLASTQSTKAGIKSLLNQQEAPTPVGAFEYPTLYVSSATRPPVPGIGAPPYKGATVVIGYNSGEYAGTPSGSLNLYISNDGSVGTLLATLIGNTGTYRINNLLGNTTYYVTAINEFKNQSSTLQFTTPAYLYLGYTPKFVTS